MKNDTLISRHKIHGILSAFLMLLFGIVSSSPIMAAGEEYLTANAKSGDGIYTLLSRYKLDPNSDYIKLFKELNEGLLTKNGGLKLNTDYRMPIYVYKYNGKSIRSTIDDDNMEKAKEIQAYNSAVHNAGLQDKDYRIGKKLWVPLHFLDKNIEVEELNDDEETVTTQKGKNIFPIFGKKYQKVKMKDSKLKGHVFYLVAGHGGPDPGAVGYSGDHELCEDEYAYDVILRLGRNLLQHGAKVYIIVRDPDDGIRDEKFLKCDNDEYYYGGFEIDLDQVTRLNKRADVVNELYKKNKDLKQHQIIIHVDSRETGELIDIFFYYAPGNDKGKKYAENLYSTIKNKYNKHQPGRGYKGFVSDRDLHMLRKSLPTTVYIELGNIQNAKNQTRLIRKDNRQSIADWLCDGVLKQR